MNDSLIFTYYFLSNLCAVRNVKHLNENNTNKKSVIFHKHYWRFFFFSNSFNTIYFIFKTSIVCQVILWGMYLFRN